MSDQDSLINRGIEELIEQAANLKFEEFKADFLERQRNSWHPSPQVSDDYSKEAHRLNKREQQLKEANFTDRFQLRFPGSSHTRTLAAIFKFRDLQTELAHIALERTQGLISSHTAELKEYDARHRFGMHFRSHPQDLLEPNDQ
jgi:septin family protein